EKFGDLAIFSLKVSYEIAILVLVFYFANQTPKSVNHTLTSSLLLPYPKSNTTNGRTPTILVVVVVVVVFFSDNEDVVVVVVVVLSSSHVLLHPWNLKNPKEHGSYILQNDVLAKVICASVCGSCKAIRHGLYETIVCYVLLANVIWIVVLERDRLKALVDCADNTIDIQKLNKIPNNRKSFQMDASGGSGSKSHAWPIVDDNGAVDMNDTMDNLEERIANLEMLFAYLKNKKMLERQENKPKKGNT
ncbi:hypothetical protein Tco_1075646, partial [Tanacetum coccineum]